MVQIRACDRAPATQLVLRRDRRIRASDKTHPPTLDPRFHPSRCPRTTQPCALRSREWTKAGSETDPGSRTPPSPPPAGAAPPLRAGRGAGSSPTRHPAKRRRHVHASRTTSGAARITRQRPPRLATKGRRTQERTPAKSPPGHTRQRRQSDCASKQWRWGRRSPGRQHRRPASGEQRRPSPFRENPAADPKTSHLRLQIVGWGGW